MVQVVYLITVLSLLSCLSVCPAMSLYEEFRTRLVSEISELAGPEVFSDYQWDSLPSFPCTSHCITRHRQVIVETSHWLRFILILGSHWLRFWQVACRS